MQYWQRITLVKKDDRGRRMRKNKEWISLATGLIGVIVGVYGVVSLNQMVRMLPLGIRMISVILAYWLIAVLLIIVMLLGRDKLADYGFTKEKVGSQIVVGILLGIAMSLVLTLIPHFIGFGGNVDNGKRYEYAWQFVYEFCYCIVSVSCVEEFVFRGFVYEKIRRISQRDMIAVIGSSALFGAFHFLGGNVVQMIMTACIGAFFCLCRLKIKNCTIVSLIIAHGIYDALITVWASMLL